MPPVRGLSCEHNDPQSRSFILYSSSTGAVSNVGLMIDGTGECYSFIFSSPNNDKLYVFLKIICLCMTDFVPDNFRINNDKFSNRQIYI